MTYRLATRFGHNSQRISRRGASTTKRFHAFAVSDSNFFHRPTPPFLRLFVCELLPPLPPSLAGAGMQARRTSSHFTRCSNQVEPRNAS